MEGLVSVRSVAVRVRRTPPRCGQTRLVCIDGPSGSGKTTLAGRLAGALGGAPVLHMDDLYPGWDGLAAAVPLLHEQVVAPLAAGRPARYRMWDWHRDAPGTTCDLGTPELLVVEGAGSGARVVGDRAVLVLWLDAPRDERFRRGITRDGDTYRPHWERWAAQEAVHFAAEATATRADLRVNGAAETRDDDLTLLPPPPAPGHGDAHAHAHASDVQHGGHTAVPPE